MHIYLLIPNFIPMSLLIMLTVKTNTLSLPTRKA